MNTEKLREAFEDWTEGYWAQGHDTEYMPEYETYVDEQVETAWKAFQVAHGLTLSSLCVGVDSIIAGAYCSLMSKIGDTTTVLAGGFTEAGTGNLFRAKL